MMTTKQAKRELIRRARKAILGNLSAKAGYTELAKSLTPPLSLSGFLNEWGRKIMALPDKEFEQLMAEAKFRYKKGERVSRDLISLSAFPIMAALEHTLEGR